MTDNDILSLMWKSILSIDNCRKTLIENEDAFIKNLVTNGLLEHEAKQKFHEQIAQYVQEMSKIGNQMNNSKR